MSLIPTYFLDCVAAIGVPGEEDSIKYVATAFLFGHPGSTQTSKKKSYYTFVVTNRHVVNHDRQLWVRFRAPTTDQDATPFPVPAGESPAYPWILHPDPSIDLAIMSLEAVRMPSESKPNHFFTLDRHVATREKLRSSECDEGNEVFTLGFPMGIAGTSQNDVIVRHGIIARIRDWYDGRSKDFLIDSSIYPGNSGGPVVLKPVITSIKQRPMISRARLLGLVAAYLPYQDFAISQQTGRVRLVSEENSGLAKVVPIDTVIELTSIIAEVYDNSSPGSLVTFEAVRAAVDALVSNPSEGNT